MVKMSKELKEDIKTTAISAVLRAIATICIEVGKTILTHEEKSAPKE